MAKDIFNRYIWLVDTIYRAGRLSFEDINRRWVQNAISEGDDLPLRTFHNHRQAIEEMFDIIITCDKRNEYKYYIENAEDMERGGVRSWLLNTFAVNNLINESHKLKKRILFEEIPSGQRFLTAIIEAMRDGLTMKITYQGFQKNHASTFVLEPYMVKVFKQRWYVVGKDGKAELRIYGLDRISHVEITSEKFKFPKSFDPQTYFNDCFGVTTNDGSAAEQVKLKVFREQVNYIRALPLHHSQEEIESKPEYAIFTYYIKPTFDFQQEILSQGAAMEVLEPKWFRKKVGSAIAQMNNMYR